MNQWETILHWPTYFCKWTNPGLFCVFSFFSNILQKKLHASAGFELGSSELKACTLTQRTLSVGGSNTVKLVSNITIMDLTASLHANNNNFLKTRNPSPNGECSRADHSTNSHFGQNLLPTFYQFLSLSSPNRECLFHSHSIPFARKAWISKEVPFREIRSDDRFSLFFQII